MATSDLDTLFSSLFKLTLEEVNFKLKSRPVYRKGGIHKYIAYMKYLLEPAMRISAMPVGDILRVHAPSVAATLTNMDAMQKAKHVSIDTMFSLLYLISKAYGLRTVITSKSYNTTPIVTYAKLTSIVLLDIDFGKTLCTQLNIKQEYANSVWTFKENLPWQPNQEQNL